MHRAGLLVLVAIVVACGRKSPPPSPEELTGAERSALASMSPLPAVPKDPTNAVADAPRAAALGQMLFFDEDLAGEPGISCRTCHAGPAMDDPGKHVSRGAKLGSRNSPPVINAVFYKHQNWGGKFDTQWGLVIGALEKPEVMAAKRADVVDMVKKTYRAELEAIFGPVDGRSVDDVFADIAKTIAAYMRQLVARDAPFDRWIAGDETAVSAAAKRGAKLFVAHCKSCHDGPHFTDNKFHALAVAQFGEGVPAEDLGRFGDVPESARRPEMRGQFRTPTLRNVAVTAPYMHAGQFATLDAVMAFYNAGGGSVEGIVKDPEMKRLGLTPAQQADLVAFMQTLTDTSVPPALLVDTSR
ncbi:MAG: cytochrome-c peroxidase [Kofleriaceae bacterium]